MTEGSSSGSTWLARRGPSAPLRSFLRTESGSAGVLVAAVLAALIWANISAAGYQTVWGTKFSIRLGTIGISHDLRTWVNSGPMTLFFLVVGLQARRELDLGDLRERRRFILPVGRRPGRHADPDPDLYLGQIVELGSWDQVSDKPAHPYTAALQSAVPVADPSPSRSGRHSRCAVRCRTLRIHRPAADSTRAARWPNRSAPTPPLPCCRSAAPDRRGSAVTSSSASSAAPATCSDNPAPGRAVGITAGGPVPANLGQWMHDQYR